MKSIIIGICFLLNAGTIQAQRTKMFSLSPMTKETVKVNGMVLGVGHFQESPYTQVVNGLNVDLFILSPFAVLHGLNGDGPRETQMLDNYSREEPTKLVSNGVNLALGGYYGGTVHNGLSIAMYNLGKSVNGVSINVAYNSVKQLNGLHISGIGNFSYQSQGANIGLYNNNIAMSGLQLGIVNKSEKFTGVQLGIYNKTNALSGLQLGFFNKNAKRTLPFINF
ncbi:LA_2272 family surface repeat-containing protein [Parapedobacter tibetensis]|uniref:LA_2272 family surface repeat-containing protein n=1 Tax=Parapedobacter tibetensis TaxID=2972951 RepID=UPI00214D42EC|nr:hypothetical protein [Parapedobacter tibetensis]